MPSFEGLRDAVGGSFLDSSRWLDCGANLVLVSNVLLVKLVLVILFHPAFLLFILFGFSLLEQLLSLQILFFLFLKLNNDFFAGFQQFEICLVRGLCNVNALVILESRDELKKLLLGLLELFKVRPHVEQCFCEVDSDNDHFVGGRLQKQLVEIVQKVLGQHMANCQLAKEHVDSAHVK